MSESDETELKIEKDKSKVAFPWIFQFAMILTSCLFLYLGLKISKELDELHSDDSKILLANELVRTAKQLIWIIDSHEGMDDDVFYRRSINQIFEVRNSLFHLSSVSNSLQIDSLNYEWKDVLSKLEFLLVQKRSISKLNFINPNLDELLARNEDVFEALIKRNSDFHKKLTQKVSSLVIVVTPMLFLILFSIFLWNKRMRAFLKMISVVLNKMKNIEKNTETHDVKNDFEMPALLLKSFHLMQSKYQRQIEKMDQKIEENSKLVNEEKRNLSEILDYAQQAIFRIDASFSMVSPISLHSHTVFGENIENKNIFDVLFVDGFGQEELNRNAKSALIGVMGESEMQWDLMEHLLPKIYKRFRPDFNIGFDWQILKLNYSPLYTVQDELFSIIVVAEDITELENVSSQKQKNDEEIKSLQLMSSLSKEDIEMFLENTVQLLSELLTYLRSREFNVNDTNRLIRKIHTLKGNARIVGFEKAAEEFHNLEDIFFEYSTKESSKDNDWVGQLRLYDSLMEMFSEIKLKHTLAVQYFSIKSGLYDVLYWEIFHLFILFDFEFLPNLINNEKFKITLVDDVVNKKLLETLQLLSVLTQRTSDHTLAESMMSLFRLIENKRKTVNFEKVFEHLYLQSKRKIVDWLMKSNKNIDPNSIRSMAVELADWNFNCSKGENKDLKIPENSPYYLLNWIWGKSGLEYAEKEEYTLVYLHFQMQLGMVGLKRPDNDVQTLAPTQLKKVDDNSLLHSINLFFNSLDRLTDINSDTNGWTNKIHSVMKNKTPSVMGLMKEESFESGSLWIEKIGFEVDPYRLRLPNGGGYWREWIELFHKVLKGVPSTVLILDIELQIHQLINTSIKPYDFNDAKMVSKQAFSELRELVGSNYDHDNILINSITRLEYKNVRMVMSSLEKMIKLLSFQLEKKVDFKVVGDGGLLPDAILERLMDILGHLMRNAMDHGIESNQERRNSGKPVVGNILLQLYQGKDQFLVALMDDGRGIDREKLYSRAISLGVVDPLMYYNNEDKLNLIFIDRVSTANQTTLNSGRGVGMSFVKDAVEKLDGELQIHSELKKGTEFVIRLPLKKR